jgi:hypothetical protein
MIAGALYPDPDAARRRMLQTGEMYRKQTEADAREKQNQITQDQFTNNKLTAERYALDQSLGMQGNPNNPRTVHDTSMTISSPGGEASSSATSGGSRRVTGGFGGNGAPQIDGRYMNLVGPSPDLNSTPSPRATMGDGNFTPTDARAYMDAAFARLKASSGAAGQSGIQTAASQLAGRGIGGSGSFGRAIGEQVARATQPLADLNVAHLGQEYAAAGHAQDLNAQRNNAIYQGDIQQRGQDQSMMAALNALKAQIAAQKYSGEISMRGQDLESLYRLL